MTLGGGPCGDPQREEEEENSDGEGKEGLGGRAGLVKTSGDLFEALPGEAPGRLRLWQGWQLQHKEQTMRDSEFQGCSSAVASSVPCSSACRAACG